MLQVRHELNVSCDIIILVCYFMLLLAKHNIGDILANVT